MALDDVLGAFADAGDSPTAADELDPSMIPDGSGDEELPGWVVWLVGGVLALVLLGMIASMVAFMARQAGLIG